jgi:hypothetical protein
MDVHLATTHIYALNAALDFEAAKQQAIDKRLGLVAGGLGGLLSRPKPEEVDLVYSEIRFEPFWHTVCATRYAFERNKEFAVPVSGVEVRKVTILGQEFEVAAQEPQGQPSILKQLGLTGAIRTFSVPGVEHCVDENRQERVLDAVTGQPAQANAAEYIHKEKTEMPDLSAFTSGDALVVLPSAKATQIVKTLLATMVKPIQADKILEEVTSIETLDLYFRPVYAFEFAWKPKNKTGVAEFDAVTGAMTGGKALHTKSDKPVSREGLFDINSDTVTSILPAASTNVKLIE